MGLITVWISAEMYETTFRILETDDEHFYVPDYHYHWYYSGFDLPDEVLRKNLPGKFHSNYEII